MQSRVYRLNYLCLLVMEYISSYGIIILFVLLLAAEMIIFIKDNKEYSFSYELKSYLPAGHHGKNITPHMAGMLIFPIVLFVMKIIEITKYKVIHIFRGKTGYFETCICSLKSSQYGSFFVQKKTYFSISTTINMLGILLFVKVFITGAYFLSKQIRKEQTQNTNRKSINILRIPSMYTPLVFLVLAISLIINSIIQVYNIPTACFFRSQYSHIAALGHMIFIYSLRFNWLFLFLMLITAYFLVYLMEKVVKRTNNLGQQQLIIRYFVTTASIFAIISFAVIYFFDYLVYSNFFVYSINKQFIEPAHIMAKRAVVKNNLLKLFKIKFINNGGPAAITRRDFGLFLIPLLLGSIDDIGKNSKKIFNLKFRYRLLMLMSINIIAPRFMGMHPYPPLYDMLISVFLDKKYSNNFTLIIFRSIGFIIRGMIGVGAISSINFTDGEDGMLAICISGFLITSVIICLYVLNNRLAKNLILDFKLISYIQILVFFIICMGVFFIFNRPPKAKIFLGETGAFMTGAVILTIVNEIGLDFHYYLAAIMCCTQFFSTMIQLTSIYVFKRKVLLCAPLHHHLELKGYNQKFILTLYGCITFLMSGVSLIIHSLPWMQSFFIKLIQK